MHRKSALKALHPFDRNNMSMGLNKPLMLVQRIAASSRYFAMLTVLVVAQQMGHDQELVY